MISLSLSATKEKKENLIKSGPKTYTWPAVSTTYFTRPSDRQRALHECARCAVSTGSKLTISNFTMSTSGTFNCRTSQLGICYIFVMIKTFRGAPSGGLRDLVSRWTTVA